MKLSAKDSAHPTDEEIALCAYRIWLQEGCPHGLDQEHWLRAKEQLTSGMADRNSPTHDSTRDAGRSGSET